VTVTPNAPTAFNDFYAATASVPLNVTAPGVLVNDIAPAGGPLTAVLVSGPTDPNGSLTLNANGSFTYTYGTAVSSPVVDTFTYMSNDGTDNSNVATVFITISPLVAPASLGPAGIGVFRNGQWRLDVDGNFVINGADIFYPAYGLAGDLAVAGDWDGDVSIASPEDSPFADVAIWDAWDPLRDLSGTRRLAYPGLHELAGAVQP
jgi:hypothetical protein